jgi:uncharacterized protein with NRDE domain
VTRDGRVAVLTNFLEENAQAALGLISRGAMVKAYLTPKPEDVPDSRKFAEQLVTGEGARGAGGFSLVCGRIGSNLAVVSNRMTSINDLKWISRKGESVALSNAAYGDHSWPKVEGGERLMKELIDTAVSKGTGKDQLIEKLYELLDRDTMPRPQPMDTFDDRLATLRKTIFVPAIHRAAAPPPDLLRADEKERSKEQKLTTEEELEDVYATQKQTVVLVDRSGLVTYIEKTLFQELRPRETPTVRKFEFQLPEEWHGS